MLSYNQTGRYTSERHERACQYGLLTAGEAAQKLSSKFKVKILATDIKQFASEWHHSGFYKPQNGGKKIMGRTFFFDNEAVETATNYIEANLSEFLPLEKKSSKANKASKILAKLIVIHSVKTDKTYCNRYSDYSGHDVIIADEGEKYKIWDMRPMTNKKFLTIPKENIDFLQINSEIIIGSTESIFYYSREKQIECIKEGRHRARQKSQFSRHPGKTIQDWIRQLIPNCNIDNNFYEAKKSILKGVRGGLKISNLIVIDGVFQGIKL